MRKRSFSLVLLVLMATGVANAEAASRKRPKAALDAVQVSRVSAGTSFEQALRMLKLGRVAEARALLRTQLKEQPGHLEAHRVLAQLLLDGGFDAEAEAVLGQAQALSPRSTDIALTLALLQAQRGAVAVALTTLEASRASASGDAAYLAFMAALCQRLSRHVQANALLEEALAVTPGKGEWLYAQWLSRRALGDAAGARMSAEEALASGQLAREQARELKAVLRREAAPEGADEDSP